MYFFHPFGIVGFSNAPTMIESKPTVTEKIELEQADRSQILANLLFGPSDYDANIKSGAIPMKSTIFLKADLSAKKLDKRDQTFSYVETRVL